MKINDCKIVWPILKARLLSIKNYFFLKLDRITRIEIVIFIIALLGIFLHRINLKLYWVVKGGSIEDAWGFFLQIMLFLYLLTLLSVFSFTKKSLRKSSNAVLISLPFSSEQVTLAKVFQVLLPFSVVFVLTFGTVLIFCSKANVQFLATIYILLKALLLTLSAQMAGIATAVVLSEKMKLENRLNRLLLLVILVLSIFLLILNFDNLLRFSHFYFWLFIAASLFHPHILTYWSMNIQLKYCPENLTKSSKKTYLKPLNKAIAWYIAPVPKSLKPIVYKDALFATRYYKSYIFTFLLLFAASIIGLFVITDAKNAGGWLVFINVLGCYWLTNLSFRFNEESVENFAIIKMLELSPKQYWWSKFFTSFLPLAWIMLFSYPLFMLIFKFDMVLTAQSFFISFWLCFTLVFFQTNFSLYSYPYARFAPLWYNMYIVLAVLFFTIFLFPPLTIAFLLLGYLAIFRVLGRIKTLEVI